MVEYSIFLDESGVESYKDTDSHYVVAGLVVQKDYFVKKAIYNINLLKRKYFKSDQTIFHIFDMLRRNGPFKIFNDIDKETEFWKDYTELINDLDFKVLAAVVNKSAMVDRYIYPQAPKRVALPLVYENIVHFLAFNDGVGKVFVEEFNEVEDQRIFVQYHLTMANGTSRLGREGFIKHIKGLKFLPKRENILGLQLADTIAYMINFEAKGKLTKRRNGPDLSGIWNAIKNKTYDGNKGEPERYGIKHLP